jgi:hypothetical protein
MYPIPASDLKGDVPMPNGPNIDQKYETLHQNNIDGTSDSGTSVEIRVSNLSPGAPVDVTVFEVLFDFRDDTNYPISSFGFKLACADLADLTKKLNDLLK